MLDLENVKKAASLLNGVALKTPLQKHQELSERFGSNIYLKREDLQQVRSYKIRGAYHKIASLEEGELEQGVVCASAGNHAQGVAYSCQLKNVRGVIFMPVPTPSQKVGRVKRFGGDQVEIVLSGDTFDDAYQAAHSYSEQNNMTFVHPFDDRHVIEGQATIGLEIMDQMPHVDYVFMPVGGGGLASGVTEVFRQKSPETKLIGAEPTGAPSMSRSMMKGKNVRLEQLDKFVDGAAVGRVGDLNFKICSRNLHQMVTVDEGKICQTILELYNSDGIVVEPAGALSTAVLEQFADEIRGKNVVCVVSGSNNDITRTEEIRERAMLYSGLKHYFVVRFPQRAGALKEFVAEVLGPNDDITHFEYSKKHNRNSGPAVVGIELKNAEDLPALEKRMKDRLFFGEYLNDQPDLFQFLV